MQAERPEAGTCDAALPRAFVLTGPTAVGKSRVAQWLAERHGTAILAADSMQVYRGMDIGTAKPSAAERARVRHYGLDLVAPDQPFNVAQWLAAARAAVQAETHPPIVVGGTGLYLRCLVEGLRAGGAAPDAAARARWDAVYAADGVAGLQAALRARDPAALAALADPRNPRRLIRALELADAGVAAGGAVPARTWRAGGPAHVPFVGLRLPPAELHHRIERRVQAMYAAGLMDEVGQLRAAGRLSPTARQAIGYAEALAVWEGRLTPAAAQQRTIERTRQYAKRQRTWFARQACVQWVEVAPEHDVATVAEAVRAAWTASGPTPLRGLAA